MRSEQEQHLEDFLLQMIAIFWRLWRLSLNTNKIQFYNCYYKSAQKKLVLLRSIIFCQWSVLNFWANNGWFHDVKPARYLRLPVQVLGYRKCRSRKVLSPPSVHWRKIQGRLESYHCKIIFYFVLLVNIDGECHIIINMINDCHFLSCVKIAYF